MLALGMAGGCSWESLRSIQRQCVAGGEAGRRLEILCSPVLESARPRGWQQELVWQGSDAGRGAGAAETQPNPRTL